LKIKLRHSIFLRKFGFLTKNSISNKNFDFLKILISDENFDFWRKYRFLSRRSIFDQNFDFWRKFPFLPRISILYLKVFLTKISIFHWLFDIRPKFRSFIEILISDRNFDISVKFKSLFKLSHFFPGKFGELCFRIRQNVVFYWFLNSLSKFRKYKFRFLRKIS